MTRNRPTPEGREMGAHLARWAEDALPKLAAFGQADDRCKTCAFRAGTVPNGCPSTVMDALKAVMERTPFVCHEHGRNGTACLGWVAMVVADKSPTAIKAPWPFSTDLPDVIELPDLSASSVEVGRESR